MQSSGKTRAGIGSHRRTIRIVNDGRTTHWSVIHDAALGVPTARDEFVHRYSPILRAYFAARWRGRASPEIDDAVQEVFLDCFRADGALGRVDSGAPGGFRAYLHGVARNVARRAEDRSRRDRARRSDVDPDQIAGAEETASRLFERAWAQSMLSQATALLTERAARAGADAVARVEILRLRFEDDMPIRDIAERRNVDAARLHHDYAQARAEFQTALRDVVRAHEGGSPGDVERECARLLDMFR